VPAAGAVCLPISAEEDAAMPVLPELLEANRRYAASFTKGNLAAPPARQVAILTCMDARIDPARIMGLEEGDAHVIRNAGGRPTEDAIRSLAISQQLLGTREVIVIHHVDCGMLSFSNEQLREKLRQELGADASAIDFLPFSDLAQSVRDDVATLRQSPLLLREAPISGFIYDVRTGALSAVEG
jgi:carbonic anhydrase